MEETQSSTAVLEAEEVEVHLGGVAQAETASESATQTRPLRQPAKPDKAGFIWGTGRRKSAVARVRLKPGAGKFLVNGREADAFFPQIYHRAACRAPLAATKTLEQLDVFVNVNGGGYTGQAEATLLGVARALLGYDPSLEPILRDNDFLTRDAREVERKKYGQPGARKRFQFSKR